MKRSSTLFLKAVIILIALGVLAGLLWEPQVEGHNVNADFMTIYFRDPFLAYVYIASIPFFVSLFQAFKLLGYIENNKIFSQVSVNAVRTIQYCGAAIVAFILGAEAYLFLVQRGQSDDIAGGVMIGVLIIFVASIITTAAAVFHKLLQNVVDLKSENDLTI